MQLTDIPNLLPGVPAQRVQAVWPDQRMEGEDRRCPAGLLL